MITPQLPWDYDLLAYFVHDDHEATVLTYRDHPHHPYVIHTMSMSTGSCYWGRYFRTRHEADNDLLEYLTPRWATGVGTAA